MPDSDGFADGHLPHHRCCIDCETWAPRVDALLEEVERLNNVIDELCDDDPVVRGCARDQARGPYRVATHR